MPPAWRTVVLNRASGPSTASAAAEVASLVVEAGVAAVPALLAYSTEPVAASATSMPTPAPASPEGSTFPSIAARELLVGRWVLCVDEEGEPTGASTDVALTTGRAAAVATCSRASRAGSMRATVIPAASVNTLSRASAVRAMARGRRTNIPFAECGRPQLRPWTMPAAADPPSCRTGDSGDNGVHQ